MANETIIKKVFSISPIIEILVRTLYYSNIKFLKNFVHFYRVNPYLAGSKIIKRKNPKKRKIEFKEILKFLKDNYVSQGDLIILISSYKNIKNSGYSPDQVIESLMDLIGENGTLAMSARPDFHVNLDTYMSEKEDVNVYTYDVNKTKCNTGIIAQKLLLKENSIRSRNPINSMVAIGPLANEIMKDNLVDNNSLPHGKDSSWYKCVLNKAKIISLGVDLTQAATITKTVEDVFYDKWPVKDWYIKKKYLIKDGLFRSNNILRERSPKWSLHYAERTMCKDLIKNDILFTHDFNGLKVEIANSQEIFSFISKKLKHSYPYFYTKYNLIKFVNR